MISALEQGLDPVCEMLSSLICAAGLLKKGDEAETCDEEDISA